MKAKTLISTIVTFALVAAMSAVALVGCSPSEEGVDDVQTAQDSQVIELGHTPSADDETAEEAVEADGVDAPADESATATTTEAPKSASKASGTTSGNSGSTKSNSGSSGTSGGAKSTSPSAPAHTHDWVAQYKTVTVTDKAAWREPVYGLACSCGQVFTDKSAAQTHIYSTGHASGSAIVDYINHPAVTHTEQQLTGYKCACGATK